MKFRCGREPYLLKKGLGFLLGFALAIAVLFGLAGFSYSSVLKMPKPLPDIVKSYKSVYVHAGRPGMQNSGVQVKQGDYITILAKGTIDLSPTLRGTHEYGPKVLLSYKFSEGDVPHRYQGPEITKIYPGFLGNKESGNIFLSYGRYANSGTHTGFFLVDIIVWKTYDPNRAVKFLEEASSAQPKDKDLKEIAEAFKERQEILGGLQKATKEAEEIEKELSKIESKKVEAKPGITSPIREQITELKKPEREKPIPEQKAAKKVEEKPALPVAQKSVEEKKAAIPPKENETHEIK